MRAHPPRVAPLVLTATLLPIFAAGASHSAELILNGSFEQHHGLGLSFAWDYRRNAGSKINADPAFARSGRRSIELDLSAADGPEWASRRFAVAPGRSYRARFFHRVTQALSRGEVAVLVRWWVDDSPTASRGHSLLAGGIGRSETAGWVEVAADIAAPPGARRADLRITGAETARGPRGRIYLDDFSLRATETGEALGAPEPAEGADGTALYTVLSWDRAPGVEDYDLYLGTDLEAVLAATPGAPEHRLAVPAVAPRVRHAVTLAPYTRYFWRADAIRDGKPVRGEVLGFATSCDLLEDLVSPSGLRHDARDSEGLGLDTLQIIENPAAPGYIGVYHRSIRGEFEVRLATSTELMEWAYRRTLLPNADMPALAYHVASGGFFLAHEQWGKPGSRSPSNLGFRFYPSWEALLAGASSRDFIAPLTLASAHGSDLEGTPSFLAIDPRGRRVDVGFHFFDARHGRVDRNGTGVLEGFIEGSPRWSTSIWTRLNDALVAREASANIGDRDGGSLFGRSLMLVEGQYIRNDFGSWRAWLWDPAREEIFPLHPRTRGGSTSFGNMTWGVLRSPGGGRTVCGSYYIFSEGAAAGEAGQVIFHHELVTRAREPWPPDGARDVPLEPRLHWLSAAGAGGHEVYLGSDAARVGAAARASPEHLGRFPMSLALPRRLDPDTAYTWRVDEILADGSVEKGPVWSFRTCGVGRRGAD